MPTLEQHDGVKHVRMLFVGDSGSGKTGALTSLVKAGYRLRVIDLDNGLDALRSHVQAECPERLSAVEYQTFVDEYEATPLGPRIKGTPRAFRDAFMALDKWEDGSSCRDLGERYVLVVDSGTALGYSALDWAEKAKASADQRANYFAAQIAFRKYMAVVTNPSFKCSVIVISHLTKQEDEISGRAKQYPTTIGSALNPHIPRVFNTMLLSQVSIKQGKAVRTIKTEPTMSLDVKHPAARGMKPSYPVETGLAEIFSILKGTTK